MAILSYLYGGVISDKFQPKVLIAISLFFTAFGGIVLSTYPPYLTLQILWGYWGFTTVFLFWGAMIKATRVWGGSKNQGQAFGLLDGGRGLVAASMGTLGVVIFSMFLTNDIELASLVELKNAFRYVILFSSLIVFLTGILVIIFMESGIEGALNKSASLITNIKSVLKTQSVCLIMFIIMAAYVGYKVTDIYSLYASDVMNFDDLEAANIGSLQLYLRPLICLLIALFSDKKSYINLVFAEDIIETISTEIYNQCNSISRITSYVDVNTSSIYDFLNSKKHTSNNEYKKLKTIDSLYLENTEIPPINEYYEETNIYNSLTTLIDF